MGAALLPTAPSGRLWRACLSHLGVHRAGHAPVLVELGEGRRELLRLLPRVGRPHVSGHACAQLLAGCATSVHFAQ